MKGPTIVPWKDGAEFISVYSLLFNSSDTDFVRTLSLISEKISLWALRRELPLAIDSTLNIINTILLDLRFQFDPSILPSGLEGLLNTSHSLPLEVGDTIPTLHHSAIGLAYASTIVRFVNGIVDSQQQKMYAQSINKLAELQDLPRIFVDARHEATHDKVPPINYLRQLSVLALQWLRKMYWDGMIFLYSSIGIDEPYPTNISSSDLINDIISKIENPLFDSSLNSEGVNLSNDTFKMNNLSSNLCKMNDDIFSSRQSIGLLDHALSKYVELFHQILPITDPLKAYLNTDALPRPISRMIADFYSEFESAGSSLPTQRLILSKILRLFLNTTSLKYECILWSHLLSPMIINCPLSIEFFLSTLIHITSTDFLIDRLFRIWLNNYSLATPIQIIYRVCEVLFLSLPTEPTLSISFLSMILDRFSDILHPLLIAVVRDSVKEQHKMAILNDYQSNQNQAIISSSLFIVKDAVDYADSFSKETINFVKDWRVCPLGSIAPISLG